MESCVLGCLRLGRIFPRLQREEKALIDLTFPSQSTQSHIHLIDNINLIDKQSCILRKAGIFKEGSMSWRPTAAKKKKKSKW